MIQAKLLVIGGGECDKDEFALALPATIGRGRENAITLAHPLVSRQHCQIFEGESGLMVQDLGSLNGTYVGSERIEGDHSLQPGDLLTIGIVTFRVVFPESEAEAEAGLRLESVLDDEPVDVEGVDTRLASGDWNPQLETETLTNDSDPPPRRAK